MNTTVWSARSDRLITLCCDFWPHGEVSRSYGVFREEGPYAGASERAIFVVDRSGKIVFSKVYESGGLAFSFGDARRARAVVRFVPGPQVALERG